MNKILTSKLADLLDQGFMSLLHKALNVFIVFVTYFVLIRSFAILFLWAHWVSLIFVLIGLIFAFLYYRRHWYICKTYYWTVLFQASLYIVEYGSLEDNAAEIKELSETRAQFIYQFNKLYDNYKSHGQIDNQLLDSLYHNISLYKKPKDNFNDDGKAVPGNPEDLGRDVGTQNNSSASQT